jgi:asparagine synthetase B (glutamine-hydrolysing)
MCGICYIFNYNINQKNNYDLNFILNHIKSRGPDSFNTKEINQKIIMHGAVLHFQGENIQTQPIHKNNSMMLWNGEVFISNTNFGDISDTLFVFDFIYNLEENSHSQDIFSQQVLFFLESLGGPYSIIFYSSKFNITLFAKDPIGRRSLLLNFNENNIIISSVGNKEDNNIWLDIPPLGLYLLDNKEKPKNMLGNFIPWRQRCIEHPIFHKHCKIFSQQNFQNLILDILDNHIKTINYIPNQNYDITNIKFAHEYLYKLTLSIYRRATINIKNQPIMFLFSGGIDSAILVAIAHIILNINIPFELVNIASGANATSAPDRLSAIYSLYEILKLPKAKERDFKLIFVDITTDDITNQENHIKNLIYPKNTVMDINIGTALWFGSRGIGKLFDMTYLDEIYNSIPKYFSHQLKNNNNQNFDSLTQHIISEIICQEKEMYVNNDLNYILLSKIRGDKLKKIISDNNCKTLLELVNLYKKKNLVKTKNIYQNMLITVAQKEDIEYVNLELENKKQILNKLSGNYDDTNKYICFSRVVILGMGADETLGGYARYKTKDFNSEMNLDFSRLWERNLSRDDRIISDNGKEARFPFLDENVLAVLSKCENYNDIFDFTKQHGEKMLLRTCARIIGLNEISFLGKRAIQFGTRIADKKNSGENMI